MDGSIDYGFRGESKEWFSRFMKNHGSYVPKGMTIDYMDPSYSDKEIEMFNKFVYKMAERNMENGYAKPEKEQTNPNYDILPFTNANGDVYLTDMNGNGEIMIRKQPNGYFSVSGPKHLIEIAGGRALASKFWDNMADNDFFHNKN